VSTRSAFGRHCGPGLRRDQDASNNYVEDPNGGSRSFQCYRTNCVRALAGLTRGTTSRIRMCAVFLLFWRRRISSGGIVRCSRCRRFAAAPDRGTCRPFWTMSAAVTLLRELGPVCPASFGGSQVMSLKWTKVQARFRLVIYRSPVLRRDVTLPSFSWARRITGERAPKIC